MPLLEIEIVFYRMQRVSGMQLRALPDEINSSRNKIFCTACLIFLMLFKLFPCKTVYDFHFEFLQYFVYGAQHAPSQKKTLRITFDISILFLKFKWHYYCLLILLLVRYQS